MPYTKNVACFQKFEKKPAIFSIFYCELHMINTLPISLIKLYIFEMSIKLWSLTHIGLEIFLRFEHDLKRCRNKTEFENLETNSLP